MCVDLACVIYTDISRDELINNLSQLLPKKDNSSVFYSESNEIEVVSNLDCDPVICQQFPDGFLHFQQRIEVFPDESKTVTLENQIPLVSNILQHLWSHQIPAVAACDYEDQLPNNGGYKSTEVPWVKSNLS